MLCNWPKQSARFFQCMSLWIDGTHGFLSKVERHIYQLNNKAWTAATWGAVLFVSEEQVAPGKQDLFGFRVTSWNSVVCQQSGTIIFWNFLSLFLSNSPPSVVDKRLLCLHVLSAWLYLYSNLFCTNFACCPLCFAVCYHSLVGSIPSLDLSVLQSEMWCGFWGEHNAAKIRWYIIVKHLNHDESLTHWGCFIS